ncbi:MGT family glycosyltransferase [Marmoricola sp. OAE513]|uniref:macrolide family glycosyltransferase n=1 Tax=Marmoricola sp. OAE513 TaxID=2817894 RepID=UPI001AEAFF0E
MAKILYFNPPAQGHIGPALPVAAELVRRGHQVTMYCTEDYRAAIERTGSTYADYPTGVSGADLTAAASDYGPLELILLEYSARLAPFCVAEIERESPDLVMFDAMVLWAWVATQVTSSPTAVTVATFAPGGKAETTRRDMLRFLGSVLRTSRARKKAKKRLHDAFPDVQLPAAPLPAKGDLNIRFVTPEFQLPGAAPGEEFALVGPPVVVPEAAGTQDWRPVRSDQPLVYVSLGTIYNTNLDFYRELFAAFDGYPAQFLLSAGRSTDLSSLGPVPENFVVRGFVPQLEVLDAADVFITHGGMNSVGEGQHFGVPTVVVPQTMEQAINGRRVAQLGAGLVVGDRSPYRGVPASSLRAALDQILADPSFERAAAGLAEASRRAGGATTAADRVEQLLAAVQPRG